MALMVGATCVSDETSLNPASVSQAGVQPLSATTNASVKASAPDCDMTCVRSGGWLANGITYGAALYHAALKDAALTRMMVNPSTIRQATKTPVSAAPTWMIRLFFSMLSLLSILSGWRLLQRYVVHVDTALRVPAMHVDGDADGTAGRDGHAELRITAAYCAVKPPAA